MEKIIEMEDHRIIVSDPFTIWEQLRFELYLLILRSPFSNVNTHQYCLEQMLAMTLKRRSLISIAVREMRKSPRIAFSCLLYFLSLPDNILETDGDIYGVFGMWGDSFNIRGRIENSMTVIMACFPFKIIGATGVQKDSVFKQMFDKERDRIAINDK